MQRTCLRTARQSCVQSSRLLCCAEDKTSLSKATKMQGDLLLKSLKNDDSNFRVLLCYRANGGDIVLAHHIHMLRGNALCSSPHIQNEIISIIWEANARQNSQWSQQRTFFFGTCRWNIGHITNRTILIVRATYWPQQFASLRGFVMLRYFGKCQCF